MSEIKLDANYFESLRRAAEKGDVNSEKNLKQAVKNGDIEAMYEYGLYLYGIGGNKQKSLDYFLKVAENWDKEELVEKALKELITKFYLEFRGNYGRGDYKLKELSKVVILCENYKGSELKDSIAKFYEELDDVVNFCKNNENYSPNLKKEIIEFYKVMSNHSSKAKKRYVEITTGISTNKQEVKITETVLNTKNQGNKQKTETTPNIQKPKQIPNEVFKKSDSFINKRKEEESENKYSEIKKLADKGDGKAILEYFYLIYNNEIDANEEEKTKYYKMAADMNIIDMDGKFAYDYANILYDNDENKKAFEYFKKAADMGNREAIIYYFYLIKNNIIKVKKEEKSKYYKMAANIGEHHAANEYLKLILYNKVDIGEKEKLEYIKMMAEKGNVRAAYEYGCILYNGFYGVTINKEEANDFLKFAADMGIADTDGKLAYNYANILYKDNKIEEALKYFKKAADRGNKNALEKYNLVLDEKRVIECFKIMQKGVEEVKYLANKGNIEAMYELGNYYRFIKNEREADKYYKMAADNGYEKTTIKFKNDPLSEKINRFEEIRDNLIKYYYNLMSCNISNQQNSLEYLSFFNFKPYKNPALEQLIDEEIKRISGDDEYNKIYFEATDGMNADKTFESNKISYKELIKVECFKNLVNRIFNEITKNIESYKNLDEATIIVKATEKIKNELAEENRRKKTDEEKIEFLEERNKFLEVLFKKSLSKDIMYCTTNPSKEEIQKEKESENKKFEDEKNNMKKMKESYYKYLLKYSYKKYEKVIMLAIIANEKEIEQLKEQLKNKNKPVTERVEELKREARSTKQEHAKNGVTERKTESKLLEKGLMELSGKTQSKEGVAQSNSPI